MKLKPKARWRCSDGTIRESNVLLGPSRRREEREQQRRHGGSGFGMRVRPENQRRGVGDDRDHDHADRAESVGERSPNGAATDADERGGGE